MITVSLVSHNHGSMIPQLLIRLQECQLVSKIIITLNTNEYVDIKSHDNIEIINNDNEKGFSANHNNAFAKCKTPFFCIINPDVLIFEDPFTTLINYFDDSKTAIVAPFVLNSEYIIDDSIRKFPTPLSLLLKATIGAKGTYRLDSYSTHIEPDWVAGMFMLFRSEFYGIIGGLDERFILYYEDVDICVRLREAGLKIIACPSVQIIHDAQRSSRREFRYMRLHLTSMLRYFLRNWRRSYPPAIRNHWQRRSAC